MPKEQSQDVPELTDAERAVLQPVLGAIVETRAERSAKVAACMEALAQADDTTRFVAGLSIRHYLSSSDHQHPLAAPLFGRMGDKVSYHTEGMYMASGDTFEMLCESGEFTTLWDMTGAAKELQFVHSRGIEAAEFFYHWTAAHRPTEKTARTLEDFGLKSGRMRHSMSEGDFSTQCLLFHKSLIETYIQMLEHGGEPVRQILSPIIVLAGTSNWELATSMLSQQQKRKLGV